MENKTVYAQLRKAESFMQQIPEGIRTLYKFNVTHTETDFVIVSFRISPDAFVGFHIDRIKGDVRASKTDYGTSVTFEAGGTTVHLHDTGYTHFTL